MNGQRFLSVDWLLLRLIAGVALVVIGPLALGLYLLSQLQFEHAVDAERRSAAFQARMLEVMLRHEMIENDRAQIERLLEEIALSPDVQEVMILDHDGVVRMASDASRLGQVIAKDSATCKVCHGKRAHDRREWLLLDEESGPLIRSMRPIWNREACHRCHDPENRINGVLILDLSMAGPQAQLATDRAWILAGTSIVAGVLLCGLGLLFRRVVLNRLYRLGDTARGIAAGELSQRATVDADDLIGELATDFNSMADSVTRLLTEVQEREAQMNDIVNGLDDGLIVLDREHKVLVANASFCQRSGNIQSSARGRPCRELTGHQHDPAAPECPAARCFATGEPQRAIINVPRADGKDMRTEEVLASPVTDDDGTVVSVVELWRDITQRIRDEEQLAAVERLSSLGALASGLAHEMNTPLASMLTSAEGLLARVDESGPSGPLEPQRDAIREGAEIIRQQVLRCRKATEQFRRFTRGIPPSVEPLDLRQVVEGVVSLVAPTARDAQVVVELEGEVDVPPVSANPELVQHVVLNLLINAIQSFGPEGGRVVVTLETLDDVRIQVRDTGSGIAGRALERLFEPFRSAKLHGTGLGLFLSRSFMRRFGGDVKVVETAAGQGSCFEIVFRRAGEIDS